MKIMSVILALVCSAVTLSADAAPEAAAPEPEKYVLGIELDDCAAASGAVLDVSSGCTVFVHNASDVRPVGHLAKLMTYLLAAEKIAAGELSPDDKATVSAKANSMQGAQVWLDVGEVITVDELMRAISVGNANDACVALAEKIAGTEEDFVRLMNDRAAALGMENTSFADCTGLSEQTVSTAGDIALLLSELCRYDELIAPFTVWLDYIRGGKAELVSQNRLIRTCKGTIGFKLCSLPHSGECTAVAVSRGGRTLCAVLLGSDSGADTAEEAERLINTAFQQTVLFTPELPGELPDTVTVRHGEQHSCAVVCEPLIPITLLSEARGSVSSRLTLPYEIEAPVEKGEILGSLSFYVDERYVYSCDLLAGDSICTVSFSYVFKEILGNLLKM